jgi:hypothetical protein
MFLVWFDDQNVSLSLGDLPAPLSNLNFSYSIRNEDTVFYYHPSPVFNFSFALCPSPSAVIPIILVFRLGSKAEPVLIVLRFSGMVAFPGSLEIRLRYFLQTLMKVKTDEFRKINLLV